MEIRRRLVLPGIALLALITAGPCLQSVDFHHSLLNHGVDSTLLRINGGGHGGFRNPEVGKVMDRFLKRQVWKQPIEMMDQLVIPNDPAAGPGT